MHNPTYLEGLLGILFIRIEYRPFLPEECTFPMFSILTVQNQWTVNNEGRGCTTNTCRQIG